MTDELQQGDRTLENSPGTATDARQDGELATLMLETAAGHHTALMRLYEATSPSVFGGIAGFFDTPESAEQALLDIYTDVWRCAGSFIPGNQPVRSWINSLAALRVLGQVRRGPAHEAAPPEYLKDLLSARVEREPRSALAAREIGRAGPAPVSDTDTASRGSTPVLRLLPWILALVLAIAAVLIYRSWRDSERVVQQQRQELDSAAAASADQNRKLAAESARSDDLDRIDAVLHSPGARVLAVEGLPPAPATSVAIFWNVQDKAWIITGYARPVIPDKVYYLWLVSGGTKTPVTPLKTDSEGRTFVMIPEPKVIQRPATLQITLEPAGGSPQPTPPIVALGRIQ